MPRKKSGFGWLTQPTDINTAAPISVTKTEDQNEGHEQASSLQKKRDVETSGNSTEVLRPVDRNYYEMNPNQSEPNTSAYHVADLIDSALNDIDGLLFGGDLLVGNKELKKGIW